MLVVIFIIMANFPTSLDSFVNPSSSDTTAAVDHAAQHANVNDAVEALEAKLGIGASTPVSGKLLRGTGAGQSAWDKDAPTGSIVGTTDTQTLTNKTLTSPTINTAIISNPTLTVDSIAEYTGAAGVTIDGLLIKDSKLATNNSVVTSNITDDAITAAKIDWASTGANAGIWWEELGRTTLSVAGDTISVSGFAQRKFLHIILAGAATATGVLDTTITFNGNTGIVYSSSYQSQGAPGTSTDSGAIANIPIESSTTQLSKNSYTDIHIFNDTSATYCIGHWHNTHINNSGGATTWLDGDFRYVHAGTAITRIDWVNAGAGDFAIGSQVIVLGHN